MPFYIYFHIDLQILGGVFKVLMNNFPTEIEFNILIQ